MVLTDLQRKTRNTILDLLGESCLGHQNRVALAGQDVAQALHRQALLLQTSSVLLSDLALTHWHIADRSSRRRTRIADDHPVLEDDDDRLALGLQSEQPVFRCIPMSWKISKRGVLMF
jgi:hypothetical protein